MEQGSDKAQCGGAILCADVDGLAVDDGAQVAEDRVGERVRSVLMSSRLPQRRPGDAPCSALVLSGPRRREISVDNPSSVRLCGAHCAGDPLGDPTVALRRSNHLWPGPTTGNHVEHRVVPYQVVSASRI